MNDATVSVTSRAGREAGATERLPGPVVGQTGFDSPADTSPSFAAVCGILGAVLAAILVGYSVYLDLASGASR